MILCLLIVNLHPTHISDFSRQTKKAAKEKNEFYSCFYYFSFNVFVGGDELSTDGGKHSSQNSVNSCARFLPQKQQF